MKWTKRHSQNAVAARGRRRMAPVEWTEEPSAAIGKPCRPKARFTVQIRDHRIGDSLTLNLHASPWPNRWFCEQGQFSSAHLCRAIGLILQGGVA